MVSADRRWLVRHAGGLKRVLPRVANSGMLTIAMATRPNNPTGVRNSSYSGTRIAVTEKRKFPRIPEENGIAVKIMSDGDEAAAGGQETFLCLTHDISRSGLRFNNKEALDVDTGLRIHLALNVPRKIVTHVGKVRWAKQLSTDEPYSVGVEFTDSSSLNTQIWAHYLDTREAR